MRPAHLDRLARESRARAAMARAGVSSEEAWVEAVEALASTGEPPYADLEATLHVHETAFFRYRGHHRLLAEVVLPEVAASFPPDRASGLRILSAGCATGEEPYSVAMTVLEHLRPGPGWPVEIVAVDVSEAALAGARRGLFAADALVPVPPAYRLRYFVRDGDAHRVGPLVREMVRFFRHDIRRDFYLGKFDIVFCCNVLLYFTPVVRRRVMERLAGALRSGGHLFLGHADGIRPPAGVFRARYHEAGVVYRRA